MSELKAGIVGVGSYTPERTVHNDEFSKWVDTSDEWIFPRTGIRERRFARDDEYTSDMAMAATQVALERAEITKEDIDYVLVATASPDNMFPNTACWVQKGMEMGDIACLDISTACSGFVYGLELAAALVNTDSYKNVLVIGAEKLSAITNFEDRGSCILFGDGAGAAIVSKTADRGHILCSRTGSHFDLEALSIPASGTRIPVSAESIERKEHKIALEGRSVYKFAVQKFAEMAKEAVERGGISIDDVALVVPHQANINIIESSMKRAGFPMERVYVNIHKYGNTSAASVPIALDEAMGEGRINPGDYVLLEAFGGGLSWGYNLIRW
ncbi:MAG: beta-ketoacyl-ACP synthase III [Planctomycetota bacterium]